MGAARFLVANPTKVGEESRGSDGRVAKMCKGQLPAIVSWTNRRPFGGAGNDPALGGTATAAGEVSAGSLPRPAVSLATPTVAQLSGFGHSNYLDELPASLALLSDRSSGNFPDGWVHPRRPLLTRRPRRHGQLDWQRDLSDAAGSARRDSHGPWGELADRDEPVLA